MDERAPRRRLPFPARLVEAGARGADRTARAAGIDQVIEEGIEAAVLRALESPATERALARALESTALERTVQRALQSAVIERAIVEVLESELVDRTWGRLLSSEETQQLVERIAQAPEVRSAITSQGVGLLEDIGHEVSKVARRIDASLERAYRRLRRRPQRTEPAPNAGLVSRATAFAADIAILNGIFLATGALLSLAIGAVFGNGFAAPVVAIGTVAWFAVGSLYLIAFWSLSGQTPGMRFLGLELHCETGRRIGKRRAVRRLVGTVLAIIPLGLGFLRVLGDDRRQSLGDRWGGTEMLYAFAAGDIGSGRGAQKA